MMNNYSSEDDHDGISYASSNRKTDDEADGVVVTAVTTAVSASDVTETEANNTKNTNNPAPTYKPPIKKKVSYSSDVDGNTTQASSDFLSASDVEVSSLNNSYSSILCGGGGGGDGRNNNNNNDFNSSSGSLLASSISNLTASMRGISNSKSKREKEMKKEAQRSNSKKINKATYDNDVMLKDLNEWVGKTKQSCNSVTVSKAVPLVFIHSRNKTKLTAVQKIYYYYYNL